MPVRAREHRQQHDSRCQRRYRLPVAAFLAMITFLTASSLPAHAAEIVSAFPDGQSAQGAPTGNAGDSADSPRLRPVGQGGTTVPTGRNGDTTNETLLRLAIGTGVFALLTLALFQRRAETRLTKRTRH